MMEDQLGNIGPNVSKLSKVNQFLKEIFDQLENYSRCNNICLINLRDGCEGNDHVNFFASSCHPRTGALHGAADN